jgi:mono/diheme cytochrome c family protein
MSRFPSLVLAALLAASALAPAPAQSKKTGLGREATADEVRAWDIDVRPDGAGLPVGRGSVKDGEQLYLQQCASCHGEFGEGAGRWPPLAGGAGTLARESPEKTVGSFWPYASTTFDYIRRTMPFGNAQSLTNDETYALTAYLLNMNDLAPNDFVLSNETFKAIKMPNQNGFYDDDRETSERAFWNPNPCMTGCKTDVKVTKRAVVLDVTPDSNKGMKIE